MDTSMGESRGGEGRAVRLDQYFLGGFLAALIEELDITPERLLIRNIDGHNYAVQLWAYGDKEPDVTQVNVDHDVYYGVVGTERSPETREEE